MLPSYDQMSIKNNKSMYKKLISYSIFACAAFGIPSGGSAQSRPNILIIHTDEQNFRTLGCYRRLLSTEEAFPWGEGAVVETPAIDGLAERGVLFNRCYATSPVSSPSRAAFLTGLYAMRNGVFANDMVLAEVPTFAHILRENGYATGYIGKLHLNGKGRPEWNPKRDFGFTDPTYMYNRGHWKKIVEKDGHPEFRPEESASTADSLTYPTDYFTDRATEYIRAHRDSAFCLVVSYPDPHSANQVRPPYDTMYGAMPFRTPPSAALDTLQMPAWAHGSNYPEDQPEDMGRYFGMVKCIDDQIARLLATLKETGLFERTLIVFTSDHGDMCGQHGLINKGVPMDDASRVPLIVSYPAWLPQGVTVDAVVSVVDFTPSLLSVCGLSPDGSASAFDGSAPACNSSSPAFDGRDLSALWKGEKLPADEQDIIFMRAPTTTLVKSDWDESRIEKRSLWIAAVTPEYKIIYSEYETDRPWLTDLRKDPTEIVNCFDDPAYRETAVRLTEALKAYGERHKDPRTNHPKIAAEMDKVLTSK